MQRRAFFSATVAMALANSAQTKILSDDDESLTGLFFDDIFLQPIFEEGHPETPKRLSRGIDLLVGSHHLKPQLKFCSVRLASSEELKILHTDDHIRKLNAKYNKSTNLVARASVGAALQACDDVHKGIIKNAFVGSRPPGHHARNYGKEEGFCFFNNISIAAKYLQKKYGYKKILIVDWDYHHGDGTEYFFYEDPSVLFFSTHDQYAYPGTGSPTKRGAGEGLGYNINVHLDCGSTNKDIQKAFEEKLLPAANQFQPEFILLSAGFDSRVDDRLGCFKIDDEGYKELTILLKNLAEKFCDKKLVSIFEGGYSPDGVATAIQSHVEELLKVRT
tara:strand:+ start:14918 stop:15916 length:999 start_codon:yes stop_codon:yes gene_type:complete